MYNDSTSIGGKVSSGIGALIDAINKFPQEWALIPCVGKKNLWPAWQKTKLDRAQLIEAIRSQKNHEGKKTAWTGVSIVTGPLSNGIMAIDFDGLSALTKYLELSSNQFPPPTKRWTSGKTGHFQILMSVPPEKWEGLKPIKIELENNQKLELRWNECSTLPPSIHPTTQKPYFWEENETAIAECPDFILDLMRQTPAADLFQKQKPETPTSDTGDKNLVEVLEQEILPRLDAEEFYGSYLKLKSSGKNLKGLCPFHDEKTASFTISPTEKVFKCFGCSVGGGPVQFLHQIRGGFGSPTGKDFYSVVMELADRVGVRMPDRKSKTQNSESRIQEPKPNNLVRHPTANVLTHDRFKPPSVDLRQEITALVKAGTTGSELTAALLELSRGSNAQQVERIYKEILEEADRDEQRLDRKADLEKLVEISNRRLTLEKYLHPNLAEPIKKVSAWMGVDPEAVLTHLLPIAAGLINPNSRIVVKKCTNFVEPCLLYSAVVAETGSRKTPTLNIPKAPLVKLQAEEDARYKAELDAYKQEIEAYNHRSKENKDDAPPVPPHPPREFYVDNITVESLDEIKGFQPNKAFTMIKDELSGLFASHGAYKGGRGSDKESFLSGWGGGGVKKNRRSKDSRVSLARDSLSITGGIQPDKLRTLFGDFTDGQGEWARFLWYQMPMRPYKIPRHDAAYSLGDLLESIYRKLDSLPELEFYFSKDGQKFYDDWYDKRYEQTRNETKPGLKAAMAKMPGQAARLIGVLHVLNGVSSQPPEVQEEISLTTVRAGCHLAQFYLGQVTLLQGDGDALDGELTPVLKSLLEKVNELGKLTATQAKKAVWGLRKIPPEKIRQYFDELAAMDLAQVQGAGSRLTLISKALRTVDEMLINPQQHHQNQNPDNARVPEKSNSEVSRTVDEVLMESQQAKTYIYQEVQEINYQTVDVVDAVQNFNTDTQPLNLEPDTNAVEVSVEESEISEKTSTPSTLAKIEPETLVQQEKIGVDESSTPPSTVEESSTLSSTKTNAGKKHRTFELGDRVVVKDVGGIYQGARGHVVDILESRAGTSYLVKFDKPIKNIPQIKVKASDLMKL
ncbi:DUF3987 domain-containing protein [Microcoleus sp. C2C3]|uniref:DUF3987 domain-containing protein n=1 Tax=unclassified Microcoleus TaxID=2642155 RepID=UPI002FD4ABBC